MPASSELRYIFKVPQLSQKFFDSSYCKLGGATVPLGRSAAALSSPQSWLPYNIDERFDSRTNLRSMFEMSYKASPQGVYKRVCHETPGASSHWCAWLIIADQHAARQGYMNRRGRDNAIQSAPHSTLLLLYTTFVLCYRIASSSTHSFNIRFLLPSRPPFRGGNKPTICSPMRSSSARSLPA